MIRSLCGITLYMMCIDNWTDPPLPVTLDVTTNSTGPMRVGQVVQFNCTSHNHREESTLEWQRVVGPTETREQAGRSTLVHTRILTAADHGTELYCGTWFLRTIGNDSQFFYTRSRRIPIRIEGQSTEAVPLNTGGERVWLKKRPQSSSYSVEDQVSWVCDSENIQYGLVEMRQVKGNIERKLYVGYQFGHHWLSQNLTTTDKDSYIYCTVFIYDSYRSIGYILNGPPVYLSFT